MYKRQDVYNYSSYPTFNTPDSLADALKDTGFDLLSTINNHSFDMSSLGVERTLSTLKSKGFDTVGTRQKTSDDDYIIENVNNIKLGITSYTYGEIKNGTKMCIRDRLVAQLNLHLHLQHTTTF